METIRLLRTPSSERFMVRREQEDCGVLDLHYLADGRVQATLIVYEGKVDEGEIPAMLTEIDEVLLPDVSLDDKKLTFTVVVGRVVGSYQAEHDSASPPAR